MSLDQNYLARGKRSTGSLVAWLNAQLLRRDADDLLRLRVGQAVEMVQEVQRLRDHNGRMATHIQTLVQRLEAYETKGFGDMREALAEETAAVTARADALLARERRLQEREDRLAARKQAVADGEQVAALRRELGETKRQLEQVRALAERRFAELCALTNPETPR